MGELRLSWRQALAAERERERPAIICAEQTTALQFGTTKCPLRGATEVSTEKHLGTAQPRGVAGVC